MAVALWAAALEPAGAQTKSASVKTQVTAIERDGKAVQQVDVVVSDVENLGAFEFVMGFHGGIVALDDNPIEKGTFLSSSGREVFCNDPTLQEDALRYQCVTLGDSPAEGATGSGVLASVYFEIVGDGVSRLEFTNSRLSTPMGEPIDATWEGGSIDAGSSSSSNWLVWLVAGGAVLLVCVLGAAFVWRRRAETL